MPFTSDNAPITFTSPTATLSANATVHAGTVSASDVTFTGDINGAGSLTLALAGRDIAVKNVIIGGDQTYTASRVANVFVVEASAAHVA